MRVRVRKVLEELHETKGWEIDYQSDGKILALKKNLHSISVEPGGQFEVSPAPRKTLQEINDVTEQIDREVLTTKEGSQWQWLHLGVNPFDEALDIPLLPSPRYALMDQHFSSVPEAKGKKVARGREMMRLTTGLQINLDFESDEEGIEMFRAAHLIAPAMTAIFANSPFYGRKRASVFSERHLIWKETDRARSGFYPGIFEKTFSIPHYCDQISRVPLMYAYDEKGKVWDPQGKSLRDLPAALIEANALAAMRQIFTEVRFKPCCIEVRYFDALPSAERLAASAMVVGLIYDDEIRKWILKNFDFKNLDQEMDEAAEKTLASEKLFFRSKDLLEKSYQGLERRNLGEVSFLSPVENILKTRLSPAERMIPIFEEEYRKELR